MRLNFLLVKLRRGGFGWITRALLAWVGLHVVTAAQSAEVLKFCYESTDVRPWRTKEGRGLNFDLINSATKQIGVEVEYIGLPWKRCLLELKNNAVDGAIGASYKVDRLEIGAYPGGGVPDETKRLYTESYVLVRVKDAPVRWDGEKLMGLDGPVGIQLGYSIGDQLRSMNVMVDDGSTTLRELLFKLAAARLGAAAALRSEVTYVLKQEAKLATQVDVVAPALAEKPYYLMLSHRVIAEKPQLADRVWTSIERERKSENYRAAEQRALAGSAP